MTSVIRAAGAADFLALVPRLVGFSPVRSMVLVPFQGNRTLGALRLDLPDPGEEGDPDGFASSAMGLVCKVTHVDALVLVAYSDESLADPRRLPAADLARALSWHADACGLRVTDALCVGSDGWASYLDRDHIVHPLAEIPYAHPALADEPMPEQDQYSGASLPAVDLAESERVGRALADLERAMAAVFAPATDARDADPRLAPGALAAACRIDDVPLLFEEALAGDPGELDPYEAAALIWCLSRPVLRDVALVQWIADLSTGDEAFEAQMRWGDGHPYPEHVASPMWGEGPTPDPERLGRALKLARRLAAAAPRASRPGILAATAWLAWASGRSSHAARYADLAREIEPEHVLAGLVAQMAAAGHLPEWVYRRSAPTDAVTRILDSRAEAER